MRYEWGEVLVEYRYGLIGGFVLRTVVVIRVPRYLVEAVSSGLPEDFLPGAPGLAIPLAEIFR